MKNVLNNVLVTFWNENDSQTKEVEYVSTWDTQSILDDTTTWLEAQTDFNDKNSGLNLLKDYDGEFDWFEILEENITNK
jgi:hypothetical protein